LDQTQKDPTVSEKVKKGEFPFGEWHSNQEEKKKKKKKGIGRIGFELKSIFCSVLLP